MVSSLVFYQVGLIALVCLFLILSGLWPSAPAAARPMTLKPLLPRCKAGGRIGKSSGRIGKSNGILAPVSLGAHPRSSPHLDAASHLGTAFFPPRPC